MDSTAQALAARIQDAAAKGKKLCIRGGGSKDFYGGPLAGERLDTRDLNGVVAYEPSELYVTVRAGMPLAELEAELAAQGQYLPFEPPHFFEVAGQEASADRSSATCGGMLACGLAGPARASVGSVRDHVLGVSMLNGRGEHLVFGGQVMKNVAGYDLSRVLAGSMGTLGLVLDMSLKVLPLPTAQATLRFEVGQAGALSMLTRWNAQALPINASCWLDDGAQPTLTLRLRGADAAVRSACAKLGGGALAPDAAERFWADCRDQRLGFFRQGDGPAAALWRISIAPTSPALGLPHAQMIEWHGGLRWLWAPLDHAAQIRACATQAGGHATMFRAPNEADKAQGVFHPLIPATLRIQQELKRQFDPAGVFNPGRLYPEF